MTKVDVVRKVVFLARHGETEWNVEGRYQGILDAPLTARGREQAALLGAGLRDERFDAAFTSPIGRARETMRIALESAGAGAVPVSTVDGLREIHHGDWQGLSIEEVERRFPDEYRLWRERPDRVRMPGNGGESLDDVRARAVPAFLELAERTPGSRLLVLSHDTILRVLLSHVLGAPLSRLWVLRQDSACLNVVEVMASGGFRVAAMNHTGHLGRGGLAAGYRNL